MEPNNQENKFVQPIFEISFKLLLIRKKGMLKTGQDKTEKNANVVCVPNLKTKYSYFECDLPKNLKLPLF